MKKLGMWLTVALAVSCLVSTQEVSAGTDEDAISRILDSWATAFRAHDLDRVMAMYAPDVVAYDIAPPLQYVGLDAYRKDYAEFLDQYEGPVELEMRDVHIIVDGNLAVVMALERMGGTLKSGEKSDIWVRATSCFHKTDGKWLDIHDHISVPADFVTGKAVVDLKP